MSEGDYHGMATFDQALFQLFSEDFVTLDEALDRAAHPEDFRIAVQQAAALTQPGVLTASPAVGSTTGSRRRSAVRRTSGLARSDPSASAG